MQTFLVIYNDHLQSNDIYQSRKQLMKATLFQINTRMSFSQGFDPPQLSVKTRPHMVNNFFQQNFQNNTRFRFFQNYPRYPHVTRFPGKGSKAAALLQQQQLQIQQRQQQYQPRPPGKASHSFVASGFQQQQHNQRLQLQQQQQFATGSQLLKNMTNNSHPQHPREKIRDVFCSLQSSDQREHTQIKQEIVDSLTESMEQETTVPRFNTNNSLTSHKLPSLPPLYSKDVLRKTTNMNVKMRPNVTTVNKSDKRVLSSLQHYPSKTINNPVSMITSHSNVKNRHLSNSFQHQSFQRKPPTLLKGSRLQSLLIEGGNPAAERMITKVPSPLGAMNSGVLTLDRIRGTSAAPPLTLAPKKRRRRRNMEPGNRECHICGEVASSHSYYGAQVREPGNITHMALIA